MRPPEPFRHSFIALQNIPYITCDGSARGVQHSGGVLGKGQLVWTDDWKNRHPHQVSAFVEDLGVVSLDPRWLVPADVLQQE